MKELYQLIQQTGSDSRARVYTVLDGAYAGEKAVYLEGSLLWESRKGGFFSGREKEITGEEPLGIFYGRRGRVFCDGTGGGIRLVICGGGHVAIALIRMGAVLGWQMTVLEDRPEFAENARQAGAGHVLCMPFAEGLDQVTGGSDVYFAVLTRGHRYDEECLEKILGKQYAYVGMIGSRRRSKMVRQSLEKKGFPREALEAVASPIGLGIHAETPAEIAVAIAAEMIERKNSSLASFGYPQEILEALAGGHGCRGRKVLATIVSRSGSAPRGVGTKMVVFENGVLAGTVGGGALEGEAVQTALQMMKQPDSVQHVLLGTEMKNSDAEKDGMVCGGSVEIFLELILNRGKGEGEF